MFDYTSLDIHTLVICVLHIINKQLWNTESQQALELMLTCIKKMDITRHQKNLQKDGISLHNSTKLVIYACTMFISATIETVIGIGK